MEIVTYEIPQKVMVRKYPVDCEKLCKVLREHKEKAQLSNKAIAKVLNTTLTKVEHWFRQDNSFAIPDRELWFEIKKLLNIETEEFDICICEFQEKDNVFEKGNRIYDSQGICPTITCIGMEITILDRSNRMEVKHLGNIYGKKIWQRICGECLGKTRYLSNINHNARRWKRTNDN